jgi:hypothetical protein
MSQGRKGKTASEKTRTLLREAKRKPRGSYREKWETLVRLLAVRGWSYTRTGNYWKIKDDKEVTHSFRNCVSAIEFLQQKYDYEETTTKLCQQTGYTLKLQWNVWEIYDKHGKRVFKSKDTKFIVHFLERMRDWMALRGMLKA